MIILNTTIGTPASAVFPVASPDETLLKAVHQRLQSQLERAQRLMDQAVMDVRYWGNQIAVARQSLARFEPVVVPLRTF